MTYHHNRVVLTLAAVVTIAFPLVAAGQTTQPFDSLLDLQKHFTRRIEETRRVIEADRLAALGQLLDKTTGQDRHDVMIAMLHSAAFLERSEEVLALSEAFLRDHSDSPAAWIVRSARYEALIDLGRLADARKEYETASAQIDRTQWQRIFETGMRIAEACLDQGEIDAVKTLYETLRTRFSFVTDVDQVLGARMDELYWLGREAPSLEGKDLNGKPIDLAKDYKGKVVLIDFWATWCAPCLAAMPDLIDTYKQYRDRGFEIVGVNLDDDREALQKFLDRSGMSWRQIFDGESYRSPNARKYDVMAIPATFLIDRQGKIARVGVPVDGFRPVVERLLAQPAEPRK